MSQTGTQSVESHLCSLIFQMKHMDFLWLHPPWWMWGFKKSKKEHTASWNHLALNVYWCVGVTFGFLCTWQEGLCTRVRMCVCVCVCGQHRMSRNHSWSFHEIPTPHNHQTHSINSFCSHSSSIFIAYVYSATFNCAHSLQITHGYRSVNDNGKCGRHLRCFKAH